MSRKQNFKFYDHDDRGSSSHHSIRKVSFKNTFGRIQKPKKGDKSRERLFARLKLDDDIDMGGCEVQGYKMGKRRSFKGRARSPGPRMNSLRPSDWYKVKIVYGSKYEKGFILQMLLKYLRPHAFMPVTYSVVGSHAIFYVDDMKIAQLLEEANRKITLPDGHKMIIKVQEGRLPQIPVDDELKEKMKSVMSKRYIAENKALNLSKFVKDPEFSSGIYCPLSRPSILRAAIQIISENIPDLYALDLTGNKIQIFDEATAAEFQKLKNLRILHVGENNIRNFAAFNTLNDMGLTELVVKDNPLTEMCPDHAHFVRYDLAVTEFIFHYYNVNDITGKWFVVHMLAMPPAAEMVQIKAYFCNPDGNMVWSMDSNEIGLFHSEIRKRFPKLTRLDNLDLPPVISFDIGDETRLPTPQASFICNPEGRVIVREFLSQYFAIYDSGKRSDLLQAYQDQATFSMCAFYGQSQSSSSTNSRLGIYIQESRNLLKVQHYNKRRNRVHMGKENIVKFLEKLPKTQHDLSSFVVDLTIFTPTLINLNVSGVFREPEPGTLEISWPIRHFSRTFIIVPVGQGFCITNDSLFITNATDDQKSTFFKVDAVGPQFLQTPSATISRPIPDNVEILPSSSAGTSGTETMPLNESVRLQMIQTLASQTGMNLDWSKKCLDETQWNFDRAMWTFTELQKQGAIPQEAFIK